MIKKIIKIIKGLLIVIGSIFVLIFAYEFIIAMSDDKEYITDEEIALFELMSENYAHYIDNNIEIVPIEDMEYIPHDGIDYSSNDIKDAFNDFYNAASSAEGIAKISNDNAVFNDGKGDIIVSKTTSSQEGPTKKPIYTGGASKKNNKIDAFRDSGIWIDLGGVVINYIYEHSDPGDNDLPLEFSDPGDADLPLKWSDPGDQELYEEWSEPEFWSDAGDAFLERANEFDYDAWINFIRNEIRNYAQEEWGDKYDLSGMGDVITEYVNVYVDEWSDPGDADLPLNWSDPGDGDPYNEESDPGDEYLPHSQIKAEDFIINYKSMGRQFYREVLSKKQQLVYDVLATCIQRGEFQITCEFGITVDESRAVLQAVLNDHPEFFFIRGYSYGAAGREEGIEYTAESGITLGWVVMTLDDEIMQIGIDKALKDITSRAQPVIAAAKKFDSEIDRIRYIVDYLCEENVYSNDLYDCKYGQNIYSSIVTNETVCAGFSRAFHYYMVFLGIDATSMDSRVHSWNLLELDGDYYYMDVTWINNDVWGTYTDNSGTISTPPELNYEFFNFNENYLSKAVEEAPKYKNLHEKDFVGVLLPSANGTKYSYKNWYGEEKEDDFKPETPDDSWSDPGHNEYTDIESQNDPVQDIKDTKDNITEEPISAEENITDKTVIINGIDVSSELNIIELDNLLYAEGKSFIESFTSPDLSENLRFYNYEIIDDHDLIRDTISDYDYDAGQYVKDELKPFLNMDAIAIESHFTENIIFLMFIDSEDFLIYNINSMSYEIAKIDEAPRIVDGEIYIPMEMFTDFTKNEIEID